MIDQGDPTDPNSGPSGEKKRLTEASGGRSIAGHALVMSFGTFSSRLLGLLRESLLAYFFEKTITDAWITAFRIPNFFRRLFGEGSLSVSFIPVFADLRVRAPDLEGKKGPSPSVRNFVNGFYTLLLLILSTITVLGVLFPGFFVWILVDQASFAQVPGKYELTVRLTRIMFAFVFFISSFAYFMGILNALGKFGWAALAPLFFNISMIIATLIPGTWFPFSGDGLAWGVLMGGALQAGILIPQLFKLHYLPRLTLQMWSPEVGRVFRNMIPGLMGMSLMQVTLIVNTRFASVLGEGAISYIYWADRLLELPLSLISVSLGTALLPSLSDLWARSHKLEYTNTGHFYLRLNLYMSMACAVGLYILSKPIVEILFQRGHFSETDTLIASQVLRIYAFVMIPTSCIRIVAPFYFAARNTWYPAVVSAVGLGLHILMAPPLMARFGIQGLNSSSLISGLINMTLLLGGLRWLTSSFDFRKLLWQFLKFAFCGVFLGLGLQTYFWMVEVSSSFLIKSGALVLASLVGGSLFALTSQWLRLEEYNRTVGRLLKKFLRIG